MVKKATVTLVVMLTAGIATAVTAELRDILVRFNGGIGVIPAQNVAGAATNTEATTFQEVRRNTVRGVVPAAGPWRIGALHAVVDNDGRIKVKGRGLLLASGDSIGQTANLSVFATLICEEKGPFVERSTSPAGVPLEPNGDFRIDDMLNPPPSDCSSPVLLIRTTANGSWFAAGIRGPADDD